MLLYLGSVACAEPFGDLLYLQRNLWIPPIFIYRANILFEQTQAPIFQGCSPKITLPLCNGGVQMKSNPRHSNGNLRRKNRAKFRAMNAPCGICHGRLGPIHYEEPSDSKHPLSFVIDEIRPISRYKEFGYDSPRQAAEDPDNIQAAHWICNSKKGATIPGDHKHCRTLVNVMDGDW